MGLPTYYGWANRDNGPRSRPTRPDPGVDSPPYPLGVGLLCGCNFTPFWTFAAPTDDQWQGYAVSDPVEEE